MKTIVKETNNEIVIQKSRFIGIITPLNNSEDVKDILNRIKKEYPKATHYCYGYICNGLQKSNDDGEPSSTAGKPILETLIKNNLTNVLLVVVRYFGGIKLGAGGLTRAYVDSATHVISVSEIYKMVTTNIYKVEISYNLYEIFKRYCQEYNVNIVDTNFLENVQLSISSENLDIDNLKQYMLNKIDIEFINKKLILVKE